ncbi:MAG: hypothetical protein ACJ72M_23840 [Propionibacteriaceae bacterium]
MTVAERSLDPVLFPGLAAEDLKPGALVFDAISGPSRLERLAAMVVLRAELMLESPRMGDVAPEWLQEPSFYGVCWQNP